MSVYSVNNWSSATTYALYDIVKYQSFYYYSLQDSNLNQTPGLNSVYWGGTAVYNGEVRPQFIWKSNYNPSVSIQPRVKAIYFGDGYSQRSPDGISTNLLKIDLSFDLRSDKEAEAINHFFYTRKGAERFVFVPSKPYDLARLFVCPNWADNMVFKDNHSIKCMFEEINA